MCTDKIHNLAIAERHRPWTGPDTHRIVQGRDCKPCSAAQVTACGSLGVTRWRGLPDIKGASWDGCVKPRRTSAGGSCMSSGCIFAARPERAATSMYVEPSRRYTRVRAQRWQPLRHSVVAFRGRIFGPVHKIRRESSISSEDERGSGSRGRLKGHPRPFRIIPSTFWVRRKSAICGDPEDG